MTLRMNNFPDDSDGFHWDEESESNGTMDTGAIATHELFLSYRQAGFTEAQALYLVGQMLATAYRENRESQLGGTDPHSTI